MTFEAVRVDKSDTGQTVGLVAMTEADLMAGDVTVRVSHSTVNYKDGLVLSGQSAVVAPLSHGARRSIWPGWSRAPTIPDFDPGDAVLANGYGLSQTHFGGYAGKARLTGDWLVRLPAGLTPAQAMAIGTAGYTAMLCVLALERQGLAPAQGAALVTGAAGGVGSIAVALLAARGWRVIASTGRPAEAAYLRDLGAAEIIDRAGLSAPGRPLGKERWIARGRQRRFAHARQCPRADRLWRRHRRLRARGRLRSAGDRGCPSSCAGCNCWASTA